jgi:hypothetical protein
MGLFDTAAIDLTDTSFMSNPYLGMYVQETFRVTPRLTLNLGLRAEYERGVRERFNRTLAYADPTASLPITTGAQAAYAANPVAELPASQFSVLGGTLYAGANQTPSRLWQNTLYFTPRLAAAYQLDNRTVVRAGYGIFVDSVDAMSGVGNQAGYSRTTSTTLSTDAGVSWLVGNPAAGVSPMSDPFPVRADGTRFDAPLRNSLGLMAKAGAGYTSTPFGRTHPWQQRWRVGVQRQIGSNLLLDVSYAGSYTKNVQSTHNLSNLPGAYWATGNVRNDAITTNLTQNVTNPFYIGNFADLKATSPVIYQNMANLSFFSSKTIQKQALLRAYPQMNGLSQVENSGEGKTHELDLSVTKQFASGFSLIGSYTRFYQYDKTSYFHEFDAEPTWLQGNYGRPHRVTITGIYELPFGKNRRFWNSGPLSWVFGGFQASAIYEYQPGTLLSWGNVFYYGDNFQDIRSGGQAVNHWFNTSGFETNASKQPASYNARVFPNYVDGLRADKLSNFNATVQREFRILERMRFQFRVEAFNLQNRTQFSAPTLSPTSTNFGICTGAANTGRQVDIMGRLTF